MTLLDVIQQAEQKDTYAFGNGHVRYSLADIGCGVFRLSEVQHVKVRPYEGSELYRVEISFINRETVVLLLSRGDSLQLLADVADFISANTLV